MARPQQDPFSECSEPRLRARLSVLGGDFLVESDDAARLRLAVDAFGGLPRLGLGGRPRRFRVRLVASRHGQTWGRDRGPSRPALSAGNGLLCATLDAGNFAVVDIDNARALISISSSLLRHRQHARSELVELAFLTLASRAQRLVPLHAACVGAGGAGLLLIGDSGTGKSTLSLHALGNGMTLLSEDSAFVALDRMRVTGVPNYLHLRPDTLGFLAPGRLRDQIEAAPVILRHSGVRKLEVDLREVPGGTPRSSLTLVGIVLLTRRPAGRRPALQPIARHELIARLRREQPYASGLANWRDFEQRVAGIPACELRRATHPDIAIESLHRLLGQR